MWLVFTAMRRPITILVAVMSVALASIMAIRGMKVDIFPKLGAPAIYVAPAVTPVERRSNGACARGKARGDRSGDEARRRRSWFSGASAC